MKTQDLVDSFWTKIAMGNGVGGRRKKSHLPVSRQQARAILDAVFLTIEEALEQNEEVLIPRFGKFKVKQFPEGAIIRIPRTGGIQPRPVDRMHVVKFRPSEVLNRRVNLSTVWDE